MSIFFPQLLYNRKKPDFLTIYKRNNNMLFLKDVIDIFSNWTLCITESRHASGIHTVSLISWADLEI